MASFNVLLGAGTALPSAGSHQIVIGTSADKVFLGDWRLETGNWRGAGGAFMSAAGLALGDTSTITASGEVGRAGASLMSGTYWSPMQVVELNSAATPLTLPAPLAPGYSVTGTATWTLALPEMANVGLWLKNFSSAEGAVSAAAGVVPWGATSPGPVTLPSGASSYFASDANYWYALGAEPVIPPTPPTPPGVPVAGSIVATGRPGIGPVFIVNWLAPTTGSPVVTYRWSISYFGGSMWLPIAGGTTTGTSVTAPYAYTRGVTYRADVYGTNAAGNGPTLTMTTVA